MRRLAVLMVLVMLGGPGALAGAPPERGAYLIAHAAHLAEPAKAWAAYRAERGWQVTRYAVDAGADPDAQRAALSERIRRFAGEHAPGPAFVLLLGDAGPGGIPTWRFAQPDATLRDPRDGEYATDHPYQVAAVGQVAPTIALGRVPASTTAQAMTVLEKVERYERDAPPGPWRRRIVYTAGEGRFGAADQLLETLFRAMVERYVPDEFDVSLTYAKPGSIYCPPPSRLDDTVLDQLGGGALLFNYVGHGTETGFDRLLYAGRSVPILEVDDLQRLAPATGALPIALLTCCSAGWFDLPNGRLCLAEAMLFAPGGPVAVIAGSRPTHPYANALLQKEVTRLLLVERTATAGLLDLRAMQHLLVSDREDRRIDALAGPIALAGGWPSSLAELRRLHVELYNLLGDPALEIALPSPAVAGLALDGATISGRVEGMARGRVLITFESTRAAPPGRERLVPVTGADDPDLEAKAAVNYPIANDLVILRLEAPVTGGRFSVTVPDAAPAGAAIVKAYATGHDAQGRAVEAFGSMRLR